MSARSKKHAPSLAEHRRLWVLVTIAYAVNREIGAAVADILPQAHARMWRDTFGAASKLLTRTCGAFDNFACRHEAAGGVPAPYDWAMHFDHETPQARAIKDAVGRVVQHALTEPVETITDCNSVSRTGYHGFGS